MANFGETNATFGQLRPDSRHNMGQLWPKVGALGATSVKLELTSFEIGSNLEAHERRVSGTRAASERHMGEA